MFLGWVKENLAEMRVPLTVGFIFDPVVLPPLPFDGVGWTII